MNPNISSQLERPEDTALSRFTKGSRVRLAQTLLVLSSILGGGCAHNPVQSAEDVEFEALKNKVERDVDVIVMCNNLKDVSVSGKPLPPKLSELNDLCRQASGLEKRLAELKARQPYKEQK